ncbi:prepilin-type N-terminal cleavage/methylation domain-containing protein [Undibacterium cyanobacteriorum]|uniref:Prepilin-type N-terminal cleavage/methylation domain-containing protein n=1 Tax=Undibacterium cyanobacteriorum TaxID=3073561 RepID=A0ABY9REL2_9BURK|nr:prepilin-type N-terminal cleavage/methylation domain-containing protein [Undibacterium sp. 20NA77.5]WMW79095.1 prepilin-type N-terminal cleavage/methylation domain-containing protein [Undibacterium sp. 20NA77.5]
MRLRKVHSNAGFTLIELLVAITVLAIIAVMGWRGLDSIIRARVSLNQDLERSRGAQISFVQLENDCAHLVSEAMLPRRESIRAYEQDLTLIRTVYEDGQATMLQVVAYRLRNGVFTRRESLPTRDLAMLDSFWLRAIGNTDDMPEVVLQKDVIAFQMRTWNPNENTWRVAGTDVANPQQANPLTKTTKGVPEKTGLEVTMQLKGQEFPLLKIFLLGAA